LFFLSLVKPAANRVIGVKRFKAKRTAISGDAFKSKFDLLMLKCILRITRALIAVINDASRR
jgi:hypothetical protein